MPRKPPKCHAAVERVAIWRPSIHGREICRWRDRLSLLGGALGKKNRHQIPVNARIILFFIDAIAGVSKVILLDKVGQLAVRLV